jgi:hypothetical protein
MGSMTRQAGTNKQEEQKKKQQVPCCVAASQPLAHSDT